jgi:hypothetical protein
LNNKESIKFKRPLQIVPKKTLEASLKGFLSRAKKPSNRKRKEKVEPFFNLS